MISCLKYLKKRIRDHENLTHIYLSKLIVNFSFKKRLLKILFYRNCFKIIILRCDSAVE